MNDYFTRVYPPLIAAAAEPIVPAEPAPEYEPPRLRLCAVLADLLVHRLCQHHGPVNHLPDSLSARAG